MDMQNSDVSRYKLYVMGNYDLLILGKAWSLRSDNDIRTNMCYVATKWPKSIMFSRWISNLSGVCLACFVFTINCKS